MFSMTAHTPIRVVEEILKRRLSEHRTVHLLTSSVMCVNIKKNCLRDISKKHSEVVGELTETVRHVEFYRHLVFLSN